MSEITPVYLAGKIHGLSYKEATEWRNQIKNASYNGRYLFLDPMDGKEVLAGTDSIPIRTNLSNKEIFQTDIANVDRADIIIANLNYLPMAGTWFELGRADILNKLLVYICDNDYRQHPFVTESADVIVPSVEAVIAWLRI